MDPAFIKVTSFYREFLQSYYRDNPDISGKSFREQHTHLMAQGYGYADYFPRYLEKNYSIEGLELIHNAGPLQNAWAKEHGYDLAGSRLLLEQLKMYQPEIIMIQDSINFDRVFLERVREEVKSLKLMIGHCCAPFTSENLKAFRSYDLMLACSEKFLDAFTERDIKSYLFPHAFEASHLDEIPVDQERANEIIFIGSLFYRNEFHKTRISYIEEILQRGLPMHIIGLLEEDPWHILKAKQLSYLLFRLKEKLGIRRMTGNPYLRKIYQLKEMPVRIRYSPLIRQNTQTSLVFGKEMLQKITDYSMGFNLHGEIAGDYAANVRMFEVAGCGTLLVTDHKRNIASLFEPDREILTYSTREECVEKLKWAWEHPAEAREIALAGQERTLRQHTVEKRVDLLHEIMQKSLSGR